jgi:hypothetical protein
VAASVTTSPSDRARPAAPADEPDHRVAIDGGWSLWRRVCVRSAGFPLRLLEPLGSPPAARAVDALLSAPMPSGEERRAVERLCETENVRIGQAVRAVAADPRFREAMVWQNRVAVKTGLDPLLRRPAGASDSKTRQKELLVASYLQRYCCKNDTIGFFGPLGWAEIAGAGQAFELRPARGLLSRRTTFFEHWAIDELARALARDPDLLPALIPRRHPVVRIEGDALWDGRLRRAELPPAFARLLVACDGTRAACDIAAELAADESLELDGPDEVYDLLTQLVDKNLAFWTIEIPTVGSFPERALDRALTGSAADSARAGLAELEEARGAVSAAAGDADRLDQALAALDEVFERRTGSPARRRAGETYAGRMAVYEDCTRAIDLSLGRELLDRLGPPLALVLQSARWFTWQVADRYLDALRTAYRDLRGEVGSAEIEYLRLWERVADLFPNRARSSPIVAEVVTELQRRWSAVLACEPGARRVARSAEPLRAPVHSAFDAPGPGWPWARYHCPDVLIAARGAAAAARGDFTLVLGETHAGGHSYLMPTWVELSPQPDEMIRALERDVETTCLFPVTSRLQATRVDTASQSRHDVDLEIGDTRSHRERSRVVAVADLFAVEVGGHLRLRTRDGRHDLDALALFGYYLAAECMAQFRFLPEGAHTPRVAIDKLVIARERWLFEPGELAFCRASGRTAQFIAARAWALAHHLPRFLFVKVPEEPKPVYVDLESPLYVELLARLARKASSLSFSEMLPGPDEAWLEDAAGDRYTSELRMAAVDPVPWRPA